MAQYFFVVVGTHTKCVINEFALDARIDVLIFQCHTVTNGIDLRRSPLIKDQLHRFTYIYPSSICKYKFSQHVFHVIINSKSVLIEVEFIPSDAAQRMKKAALWIKLFRCPDWQKVKS